MNGGYIKLSREALDEEFFEEKRPLTKLEAFMWLVKEAQYGKDPQKVTFNNKKWTRNRGELITSWRQLQKTWRWSHHNTVKNFILKLEGLHRLCTGICTHGVQINMCKSILYDNELYTSCTPVSKKLHTSSNKENKRIKEYNSSSKENASVEDFKNQILSDQMFSDSVGMTHKIDVAKIPQLLEEFILQKSALEELNHKSYKDFRHNFFFWIGKQKQNSPKTKSQKSKKEKPRKQILQGDDFTKNLEDSAKKMGVKIYK